MKQNKPIQINTSIKNEKDNERSDNLPPSVLDSVRSEVESRK